MERPAVIEIKDLKIDYRNLNHFTIQQIIKNPALKGGRTLHALRGISLEVSEGEIIGIIGENGAGKSTLLNAIAGIFKPDSGTLDTHGKRVSLMSLGVGFRHDLSGRENIMLAGLLLRYPAAYIKEKTEEIIEFSELGDAIDNPVRTYSGGMYSKLGFAITAILETDVMLIDELLSVGDAHFQTKSFRKIRDLVQKDSMTGLIVSHDMELIKSFCSRVVWMHRGRILASGDPQEITQMYLRWSTSQTSEKMELPAARSILFRDPDEALKQTGTALFRGLVVDENNGLMASGHAPGEKELSFAASNWEPVFVQKGARVHIDTAQVACRRFCYKPEIPAELIYTSLMPAEGNATIFDPENTDMIPFTDECFTNGEDRYMRFILYRKDKSAFPDGSMLEDYIRIEDTPGGSAGRTDNRLRLALDEEAKKTAVRACEAVEPDDAVFVLLADTHTSVGGTWSDTAYAVRSVCRELEAHGVPARMIVHLGDITDGRFPAEVKVKTEHAIRCDLEAAGLPVCFCTGNHDFDRLNDIRTTVGLKMYYRNFLNLPPDDDGSLCFSADVQDKDVRMIFLNSYDPSEADPYGFSKEDMEKTAKMLDETPDTYRVLAFSHLNPGLEMTPWGERVRGSREMMEILAKSGKVQAVFCGHEHRDKTEKKGALTVISTGCAALEDKEGQPLHSGIVRRRRGDVSQELFDIVIAKQDGSIRMIRFGCGGDREC